MKKPTKEEISLCKQVAEKHKKKIKYGNWYINFDKEVRLKEFFGDGYREEDCFPLWTISDCLEFLRGKNYDVNLHYFTHRGYWMIQIWNQSNSQAFYSDYGKENKNKTPLEACLKAVLAVLEEVA